MGESEGKGAMGALSQPQIFWKTMIFCIKNIGKCDFIFSKQKACPTIKLDKKASHLSQLITNSLSWPSISPEQFPETQNIFVVYKNCVQLCLCGTITL